MKIGIFTSANPSGGNFPKRTKRAIKFLQQKGHEIIEGDLLWKKDFYRSASIVERANEINNLLKKDVDVLMSSIGGDNTNSILEFIDYNLIKDNLIVCGFSDTTCLLNAIYAKNEQVTLSYGPALLPCFGNFEEELNNTTYNNWVDVILNKQEKVYSSNNVGFWTEDRLNWEEYQANRTKRKNDWLCYSGEKRVINGRLVGGNLNSILKTWGSEYGLTIKNGDILLLEDSMKTISKVEKLFSFLSINKVFEKVSAILLSKHELFDDLTTSRTPIDLLLDILKCKNIDIPILYNLDFGHTKPMLPLPLFQNMKIDLVKKKIFLNG